MSTLEKIHDLVDANEIKELKGSLHSLALEYVVVKKEDLNIKVLEDCITIGMILEELDG